MGSKGLGGHVGGGGHAQIPGGGRGLDPIGKSRFMGRSRSKPHHTLTKFPGSAHGGGGGGGQLEQIA